jgi:hypothetical protein
VYVLRWWSRAPAVADWAASAAALDAEWLWHSPVCNLTFDGHNGAAMRHAAPPRANIVGAWCAQAPDAAAWHLLARLYWNNHSMPIHVTAPRPGVLCGSYFGMFELNAFVGAWSSAGLVVFRSTPLAERPPAPSGVKLATGLYWHDRDGIFESEVWINMENNDPLQAFYSDGGVGSQTLVVDYPRESDGTGDRLYTVGWRVTDGTLQMWYVSGAPGARSVVTRTGTFLRGPLDNHPEPDVMYYLYCYNVLLHEVRLVSPAPSPEAWDTIIRDQCFHWCVPARTGMLGTFGEFEYSDSHQ